MITLYKFNRMKSLMDPSPPCLKVEAYLRMSGLPYRTVEGIAAFKKAPKGKLPFIEDEGVLIPDSSFILHHLRDKYGDRVDAHLTAEQKAVSHAFMKMMDENLYWGVVHSRWIIEENWRKLRALFFGGLSFPLRQIISGRARKKVRGYLLGHGIGRHSDAEIAALCGWDLQALADYLGDKTWFHGDRMSGLDACAYGILAQMILQEGLAAPLYDRALSHDNLVAFTRRFHAAHYGAEATA